MNVAILTSAYAPAPGGAANYTKLLATHLAGDDAVGTVQVFTEAFPGEDTYTQTREGKLHIHRKFPYRAGREQRDWRSYVDYARQNLTLRNIDRWLPQDTDVLLVHAQLHYNPTLFQGALRHLRTRRGKKLRLVLDVRDPLMSSSNSRCLDLYDEVICCSHNVYDHLVSLRTTHKQLHIIPIPFQPVEVTPQYIDDICEKYGLSGKRYLIGTNGISIAKGIDLCLNVTHLLREKQQDLCLVVAGRKRDWGPKFARAEENGTLRYIGALPQRELIALVSGSQLHMNPSPIEGLPRASLEAMAAGVRVLLPANVPEFMAHCPSFVALDNSVEALMPQVEAILGRSDYNTGYPVSDHYPESVIPEYIALFEGNRAPD